MKVGLIDVDNIGKKAKFPNLPLMKLSSYHKSKGDQVEWWNISNHYDLVYGSKVFDFTQDIPSIQNTEKLILGGIAYDLNNKLDQTIEHQYPDYSIYDINDTAYGFLTRGCPRDCGFCNVTQHQGKISHKVAELSEFYINQKEIVLLDPNMYASSDWENCHNQLKNTGAKIDFSQGIDIRVMTDKKANAINNLNLSMVHFAWDNYEFKTYEKLKKYRDIFKFSGRNMRVYVLTNYNTTHEQDLERVTILRKLDYDPYVMIFNKHLAPKITRQLQRWVNSKFIWRSVNNFKDYGKQHSVINEDQMKLFY